jgi:hypothetical protein
LFIKQSHSKEAANRSYFRLNLKQRAMNKMKNLMFGVVLLGLALTGCDKTAIEESVPDVPTIPEIAHAIVIDAIINQDLGNLSLKMDQVDVATGLDYKDLTDYLEIETGEVLIDVVDENGTILASSSYTFEDDKYYNVILVMDEEGVNPTIEVLDQSYNDFELSDAYANELGYNDGNASVYAVNAVSYNAAYKDQNLLIDVDYSTSGFAFLDEYLALEYGEVTDVFYGNDLLISDLDISLSATELSDLLEDETGFIVISETLLEDLGFENAGRYTVIILGDEFNFDSIIIDHLDAGLVPE